MIMPGDIGRRVIGIIAAGILLIGLLAFAFNRWEAARNAGAQAKVNVGQAQATAAAGVQAIKETRQAGEEKVRIDIQVKDGIDAIRNAQGSGSVVADSSRIAALCAACRMRSYRDAPRCSTMFEAGRCEWPAGTDAPG